MSLLFVAVSWWHLFVFLVSLSSLLVVLYFVFSFLFTSFFYQGCMRNHRQSYVWHHCYVSFFHGGLPSQNTSVCSLYHWFLFFQLFFQPWTWTRYIFKNNWPPLLCVEHIAGPVASCKLVDCARERLYRGSNWADIILLSSLYVGKFWFWSMFMMSVGLSRPPELSCSFQLAAGTAAYSYVSLCLYQAAHFERSQLV